MRRITPEEVLAAYAKTGLKPAVGHAYLRDGSSCALGAIYYQRNLKRSLYDWANAWLGSQYAGGFIEGFDGTQPRLRRKGRRLDGFRDG